MSLYKEGKEAMESVIQSLKDGDVKTTEVECQWRVSQYNMWLKRFDWDGREFAWSTRRNEAILYDTKEEAQDVVNKLSSHFGSNRFSAEIVVRHT